MEKIENKVSFKKEVWLEKLHNIYKIKYYVKIKTCF